MTTVAGDLATPSLLGRARAVLDAFGLDGPDLSLAELVPAVGLPKTTVFRLCQELVAWGFLERVEPSRYRLGLRLWELGQRVPRQRVLREAALTHLHDLLHTTRETVPCAVLDGTEVLYTDKLTLHHGQPQPSRVAGRLPLHCTATGKALLAHAPPRLVREVLAGPLHRRTRYTITAPGLLARQLADVRAGGVAVEREETRLGYLSVAAPVLGPGGLLLGAVSATARVHRQVERTLRPAVRAAALAIARDLPDTEGPCLPRPRL